MEKDFEWFFFTFDLINEMEIFPFHLFIFNPSKKKGSLIVSANSPLTEEKKAMILKFVKLGGVPAIKSTQKLTFMTFLELPEGEQKRLEALNKFIRKRCEAADDDDDDGDNPLDDLDQAMDENEDMFEEEPPEYDETPKDRISSENSMPYEHKYHLTPEIYARGLRYLFKEDFMQLIKELKQDIEALDVNRMGAETIKISKVFADQFLTVDNLDSRVAAVTHLFLKKLNVTEPELVCLVFNASMLRNIGLTRVNRGVIRRREFEDSQYEKHPLMSKDLLDICALNIKPELSVLVEEGHAIGGGFGFPMIRNPDSLDAAETAFMFANHLVESCFSFPKTKIGSIKSTFQEFQGNQEKAKKIFGDAIELVFSKSDEKEADLDNLAEDNAYAA